MFQTLVDLFTIKVIVKAKVTYDYKHIDSLTINFVLLDYYSTCHDFQIIYTTLYNP